jgi:hypothetical protein
MKPTPLDKPTVFVASSVDTLRSAHALSARLNRYADVVLWRTMFEPTAATVDALSSQLSGADFMVALLGTDDLDTSGSRANLLLELGMALGKLGRDRVLFVTESPLRLPSELSGLLTVTEGIDDPNAPDHLAKMIRDRLEMLGLRARPAKGALSVFLSYVHADRDFVEKLAGDLTRGGISCWFDRDQSEHARWGDLVGDSENTSDRVLLILSRYAVTSPWFHREVETALERTARTECPVLFPLLVDYALSDIGPPWAKQLTDSSYAADFTDWHDAVSYDRALRGLLRALAISADRSK